MEENILGILERVERLESEVEALKKRPINGVSARRMASKGGRSRANTLTPERRSEIARNAVQTRWSKQKANNENLQVTAPTE